MRAFLNFIKKIFLFFVRRKNTVDSNLNDGNKRHEVINESIINELSFKEDDTDLVLKKSIKEIETKVKIRAKRPKKNKGIPEFTFSRVDDIPDELKKGIIYIVGDNDYEWLIAMTCPCGCREQILLNTLKETKPCWSFVCYKNGNITLIPSVNRIRNCRSHFTITKGNIRWSNGNDYPNNY